MLGNLVPGSHLLLIWDVPGFIVCFQCPAGFRRRQGSHGSLPLPGVCAEAGEGGVGREERGASVVSPPGLERAPLEAWWRQLGAH